MSYGDVSWVQRVFHKKYEKTFPNTHYRICTNPDCGNICLEEQCLDWKHPTGARFCPKCHEVTEEISKDDIEIITCPVCNGRGTTSAWWTGNNDCSNCDGNSYVIRETQDGR